jgi:hypothetical protein
MNLRQLKTDIELMTKAKQQLQIVSDDHFEGINAQKPIKVARMQSQRSPTE